MSILIPASFWTRSVQKCPRPPPPENAGTDENAPDKVTRPTEKPSIKAKKEETIQEEEYMELFLHAPKTPICSGKTAYIRKNYHERIQRIVQVIGKNGISLSVYVDRVLEQHFREKEEVIRRLYKKNYEDVY